MAVAHTVYAEALLAAAGGKGRLAEVREELADFVAAVESSAELRSLLRNPQIEARVKRDALAAVLGEAEDLVRNFLLLVAEKGRIGEVGEIQRELERLIAREARVLELDLTTAVELSDEEAAGVVRQIEEASGRRVEATRRVDPAIIGGIVIQAGSRRLDASVRGRLEGLRQELTARR
ncbi:MAG TPA: ATP synthase F1 subunit delta [Gaiellaceae bacterium]|jgi:F-type H+-transporting ATPase subunit delta|nr:ATP synthase F1 subunit delta [Gaiellaceae bacterium]